MDGVWQRRIIVALLAVFAGLLLASLPGRYMHGDDAWLGEQAYWMARDGFVRSDLFRGLLGYDQRQMVYHKLFVLAGALVVKTLGWSLYKLKAISLISYLVFVLASWSFFRRGAAGFGRRDLPLFSLLVLSAPLVLRFSFAYRPEMMLMTTGFLSFSFLTLGLEGRSRKASAAAGAFAGLGMLTHLNGWIFGLAGLVLLLAHRRRRSALAFAAAACGVSLLYFYDLTSAETLRLYHSQMRNDLPIGEMSIWRRLLNVAFEPRRFFYSAREIFTSTLLVLSLALCWRALWARYRDILAYLGVLVVGLALLSRPRPSYYLVPLLPYIALIVTAALKSLPPRRTARRLVLVAATALAFTYSFYHGLEVVRARTDLPGINREIAAGLERGSSIVAPAGFIYNEIGNFRIQSLTLYDRWAERAGTKLTAEDFFGLARVYGNAYVILDREFARKMGLESAAEGLAFGEYVLTGRVRGRMVFKSRTGATSVAPFEEGRRWETTS